MTEVPLPEYTNPPLVETVLGIQFDPFPKFSNAHLGAYWASIRGEEWNIVADAHALEPQFEKFGGSQKWSEVGFRIKLSQETAGRLQIRNSSETRMIQVQNGRFHLNWLGEHGGIYPKYQTIRDDFLREFAVFESFVSGEGLGNIVPNQWEVTYVNHVPRNTVWHEPHGWNFFKPLSGIDRYGQLNQLESFSGEWHFVILENAGRLHVHWQHGMKQTEKEKKSKDLELIRLAFTARGPVHAKNASRRAILDGLNLGHESIVNAFCELSSDKANDYWGLKHGSS